MKVAVANRRRAPRGRPGIQGINAHLDDIVLLGSPWRAMLGDALIDAALARTIGGASTLKLTLSATAGRRMKKQPLLESKYDTTVDGLGFRYVGFEQPGKASQMVITHEALPVALLRELHGPNKAWRDKLTRAEFAKRLVREVKHPLIPFISPELHVEQPIKSNQEATEAKQSDEEDRRKGVGASVHLTVKGHPADPDQIEIGDTALRIGRQLGAPFKAMQACIVALIDESEMTNVSGGTGTSRGVLQVTDEHSVDPMNIAAVITIFYKTGFTSNEGAIELAKKNPGMSAAEIGAAVEGPEAGSSVYAPYEAEAREWVEAGGGSGTTVSGTETIRYAFREKKTESHWACITRLAKQVNWRCFESAGGIYYIAETDLMESARRMVIGDSTPGVEDTSPKYDEGKPVTEFTCKVRAKAWAAPPGSVVEVTDHGPCNGLYLVEKIEQPSLRKKEGVCDVTLRKPTAPLKEPAAKTKSTSVKFGGGTTAASGELGALEGTPKEIVDRVVVYAHRKYGFAVSPSSVQTANAAHGPTVDGNRSDHQGPPDVAWAADISDGVSTQNEADLAADIAAAFGIPYHGTLTSGELAEATHDGYRMQLIHNTTTGGDHFDHVHFGVEVA